MSAALVAHLKPMEFTMSLEAKIEALTAAITKQTTLLESLKGGVAAAPAKAEGKPAADKAAGDKKPNKITIETIKTKFGAYLSTDDKKERATRSANVKAMSEHFGVDRISEIGEDKYAEALKYLKEFEADGKASFQNEDDDGDGDDDGDDALV
jgi:hypothetical protein